MNDKGGAKAALSHSRYAMPRAFVRDEQSSVNRWSEFLVVRVPQPVFRCTSLHQ
jgi:hypothetical protein